MDTKTKVLIILGSILVLSITGVIVYEATKPPTLPPTTSVVTTSTTPATTSQPGILSSIVSSAIAAI